MTLLALEINDAGLIGASEKGLLFESEGIAWLDEAGARFGSDASGKARLEPDRVSARHWQLLDQTPLARPRPPYRTQADVVFAQLESLWLEHGEGVERLVFVLPGCYGREQLGLLLGMCGRLELPVAGFVDSALAATRRSYPGAALVHLELGLHRAILSHLDQGSRLRRSRVQEIDQLGVASVRESLIKALAAEFVRTVRFDPLHRASSEQQLYDQLPAFGVAYDGRQAVEIALDSAAGPQRIEMAPSMLERDFARHVKALCEFVARQHLANVPLVVQLSARAALLPGLAEALRSQGYVVVCLQPGAAALGALALADHLPQGSAVFLNEAPLPDVAEAHSQEAQPSQTSADPEPTHVLYLDHAYPLASTPLVIGRESAAGSVDICLRDPPPGVSRQHCTVGLRDGRVVLEDHSTYGTWVNERPVTGRTRLRLGDTIQLGQAGVELRLIHVESGRER